jgi:hypothetical protein
MTPNQSAAHSNTIRTDILPLEPKNLTASHAGVQGTEQWR